MRSRRLSLSILFAITLAAAACARPPATPSGAPASAPVWPLLGTRAPSEAAISARVVSVKVENEPPARPQSGLAAADVVYETLIEGGDTRYNALYQSQLPAKVGPVRSARLSDTFIVPQYHAIFVRIGADYVVETAIRQTPRMDDLNQFSTPAPYTRSSARPAPHNLYASLPAARAAAVKKGYPSSETVPALPFGSAPASATSPATRIDLPMSAVAHVAWTWDAAAKRYTRTFNGSAEGDAGTSRPYSASNVVVLFARTVKTKALDPAGNPTYEQILGGSGAAIIFRDGKRYEGKWTAGRNAPPRFTASDGGDLTLSVGKTWFEVLPTAGRVTSR